MVRKISEFSYILAKLFNKCLKESCVPDRWNVSLAVSVFKNVRERSTAKIYRSVGLLSVVSKAFEKLVNNRISVQMLGLISSFLSNRQFQVVLDGKSSQEYSVNAGVSQGVLLGPTLFLLYSNDLPDNVIYDFAICADDTTHYSKCDQVSDLWQQLELVLKYNLIYETQVSFDWSNNIGAIDVKIDGPVLEEKSSFRMLGSTLSSKLDWGFYIISIAKTASKKIGVLILSMKFLSPEVALYLCKSTIRPCMEYCCHVWAGRP